MGNSYFEGNVAERMGGAISGTAAILQVLDSSFRSNIARLGGAIATNLPEAQLVLGGCEFDANDAIMGPKYGPAVAANGLVEDLGENEAQPEELMCLDCELTSGIRIREPEPQAQPVQDINVPMDEPLPSAAPLDTEGMGALLPTGEDTAPLVVVEEDAEAYISEITDVAEENTEEVTADNAVLTEITNAEEDKEVEATIPEEDVDNEVDAKSEQAAVAEESIEETVEELTGTEDTIEEIADEPIEDIVLGEIETEDATEDVVLDETEDEEAATDTTTADPENDEEKETEEETDDI